MNTTSQSASRAAEIRAYRARMAEVAKRARANREPSEPLTDEELAEREAFEALAGDRS
jgi:hypothetical protein